MATFRVYMQYNYWYPDNCWYVIEKKTIFGWNEWATFWKWKNFKKARKQLKGNGHIVIEKYG